VAYLNLISADANDSVLNLLNSLTDVVETSTKAIARPTLGLTFERIERDAYSPVVIVSFLLLPLYCSLVSTSQGLCIRRISK